MVFALALLNAEHHITIHLHEAAVAIPCKARVFGCLGECLHGLVVEAEVEDGVHHAGHGVTGTGADGHQQGEGLRVTELGAHEFFHIADAGFDLALQGRGVGFAVGVVIRADFGGDGEPGRNGESDPGHFREVGAFAAEEFLHFAMAVSLASAECVNIFGCGFFVVGG